MTDSPIKTYSATASEVTILCLGNVSLTRRTRRVYVNGKLIKKMAPHVINFLEMLMLKNGEIVTSNSSSAVVAASHLKHLLSESQADVILIAVPRKGYILQALNTDKAPSNAASEPVISLGNVSLDRQTRKVQIDQQHVRTSQRLISLLELFITAKGKTVTYDRTDEATRSPKTTNLSTEAIKRRASANAGLLNRWLKRRKATVILDPERNCGYKAYVLKNPISVDL